MKIWESTHTFDHPWEKVAYGAWRKYPNPINTAVSGIDIIDRRVDQNGLLQSQRLMQTTWDIPSWVTSLIGLRNPNYSFEVSTVDPKKKTMTLKTANIDCTTFVEVDEQLTYSVHPDKPNQTLLTQSTSISMFNVPWVDRLERMMLDTFKGNSHKGRNALEWAIDNIHKEWELLSKQVTNEVKAEYEVLSKVTLGLGKQADEIRADLTKGVDDVVDEINRRARSFSESSSKDSKHL